MADPNTPLPESPHFDTTDVEANRAIEQGLGVGARELAAQREPGGVVTPDEDADDSIDRSAAVQGQTDAAEQLAATGDA